MSGGKKRLTVDVSWPVHEQLQDAQVDDGCGPTTRLRVLAELWAEDLELRQRVGERIRSEREQLGRLGRRRRAGGR